VIPHGGTVQPAVNLDHLELSRIQRLVRRVQNEHEPEFDPTIVSYVAHRLEVEPMSIEEVECRLWTAMSEWSLEAGAPLTDFVQHMFE